MNKIFDKIPSPPIKPDGLDFIMNGIYTAKLKKNIQDEKPLKYLCEKKELSFKPVGLRWNNELNDQTIIKQNVDNSAGRQIENGMEVEGRQGNTAKGIVYENALGNGINIGVLTHKTLWRKILKITSLKDLGKIPANAEFLEASFEIENTFGLQSQEIKENIKLGKKSWIRKAKVWDSFQDVEFFDEVDENGNLAKKQENRIGIKSEIRERNGKMYIVKMIPVEWLKTALFPIYTDTDVTYGTASVFESGTTNYIDACEIDTNKFAVCYGDSAGDGLVRVATVSGTTITWGTAAEITSTGYDIDKICKANTNKFVVFYGKSLRAGSVSGTTITLGTSKYLGSNTLVNQNCCYLGADKFVVMYANNSTGNDLCARVCTLSGTTITEGSESVADSNSCYYAGNCCQLDTDKFVVCYEDNTDTKGEARVATVSGTTITWGTVIDLHSTRIRGVSCSKLDTDKFVVCFQDYDASPKVGKCRVATVSGTTITWGTLAEFEGGAVTSFVDVTAIDTTHFVVAYEDDDDSDKGKSNYCSVSGTTITIGTPEEFESGAIVYCAIALISSNKIVIVFRDASDSDKGKAIVGDTAGEAPPAFTPKAMFFTFLLTLLTSLTLLI